MYAKSNIKLQKRGSPTSRNRVSELPAPGAAPSVAPTIYRILLAISLVHLLNDAMQAVCARTLSDLGRVDASDDLHASRSHLVLLQHDFLCYATRRRLLHRQTTVSVPLAAGHVGFDGGHGRVGDGSSFGWVLFAAMFVGLGSAVFHPEGSRVAHMAAGLAKDSPNRSTKSEATRANRSLL